MMPTAMIFSCHFIIVSSLFIPPSSLSFSLLSCLSYLPPLSSIFLIPPPDPFLCLTVPMLVISALSLFFPVWSQLLNFLSHLRHSTRVFALPPHSSCDGRHHFSFCSSVFFLFFSFLPFMIFLLERERCCFSLYDSHPPPQPSVCSFFYECFPIFSVFVFFRSLSGVHSIFAVAWWRRTNQSQTDRRSAALPTYTQASLYVILRPPPGPITALHVTPFGLRPRLLLWLIWKKPHAFLPSHSWKVPTCSDLPCPRSPNNSSHLLGNWPILSISCIPSPVMSDLCSQTSYTPLRHPLNSPFKIHANSQSLPKLIYPEYDCKQQVLGRVSSKHFNTIVLYMCWFAFRELNPKWHPYSYNKDRHL